VVLIAFVVAELEKILVPLSESAINPKAPNSTFAAGQEQRPRSASFDLDGMLMACWEVPAASSR
jgi:hypothetical protein